MAIIDWCPEPDGYVDLSIFLFPLLFGIAIGFFLAVLYLRKARLKSLESSELRHNSSYTEGEKA